MALGREENKKIGCPGNDLAIKYVAVCRAGNPVVLQTSSHSILYPGVA